MSRSQSPRWWRVALWAVAVAWGGAVAETGEELPEVVAEILERADRQREAGRAAEAIAGYRQAIRLDPSAAEAYVGLGALHHEAGRLEDSLATFEAGLERRPDHTTLLYNAAVVARRLDRLAEALVYADRALALSLPDASLYALRAGLLTGLERPGEALTDLERAAELAPGESRIHFRVGNLYHRLGRNEEAIEAFRRALEVDPEQHRAQYNLGAVLFEEGRHREALEAYTAGLAPIEEAFAVGEPVDPIHAQAYLNLGGIHLQTENLAEALAAYERALRLRPGSPQALYNLGYIHFRLGNLAAAQTSYRAALAVDPNLPLAYLHLGAMARRRGDFEAAVEWLREGLPLYVSAARRSALLELAQGYRAMGRLEAGLEAAEEALAEHPEDVAALLLVARLRRLLGDVPGARRTLAAVAERSPEHPAVTLELASLARSDGDADTLEGLYRRALGQVENEGVREAVTRNLAYLLLERGAAAEAVEALESLRAGRGVGEETASTSRGDVTLVYALALAASGDRQGARALLKAEEHERVTGAAALHAEGALSALEGDLEGAEAALAAAIAKLEGGALSAARASRAMVRWLQGDLEEAELELAAAPAVGDSEAEVVVARSEAALARGDAPDAIDDLERARRSCERGGARPSPRVVEGLLLLPLGAASNPSEGLCRRLASLLAEAHLRRSLVLMEEAAQGLRPATPVLAAAERAARLSLVPAQGALLLVVRGSARLLDGDAAAARKDLARALGGPLDAGARALAHNNLAVALLRLGDRAGARRELEAARSHAQRAQPEVVLNLAILLEDYVGEHRAALTLYREYAALSAGRRREVEERIARLEQVYR